MQEATYKQLGVANAIIIGYMMGTYRVIGRGGAQAVANMSGELVGQELARYAQRRDMPLETWDDVRRFVTAVGLTDFIEYERTESGIEIVIRDCLICPKRVGHHDFPGTACPWGGILVGLLGEVFGERFTSTPRLTPGETCTIQLVRK